MPPPPLPPLTWSAVAELLAPWRNYWVGTTGRDGSPHASPVWGVLLAQVLYFYTEPSTAKARNLAADPRLVVHLESGDDVLIVRGTVQVSTDPALLETVLTAFAAKYTDPGDLGYLPVGPPAETVFAVHPRAALAWALCDFDGTQRRWAADG